MLTIRTLKLTAADRVTHERYEAEVVKSDAGHWDVALRRSVNDSTTTVESVHAVDDPYEAALIALGVIPPANPDEPDEPVASEPKKGRARK